VVSRRSIAVFAFTLLGALFIVVALHRQTRGEEFDYDVLLRNGRVVDGTGNPWFHADVAVKKDRVVAVAKSLAGTARREIDAKGLIVAPVFIDMHSHSDLMLV
jgi:N-acyl-D-aspartate/D-glutamate deacylase